jgi:hypothetical protein
MVYKKEFIDAKTCIDPAELTDWLHKFINAATTGF